MTIYHPKPLTPDEMRAYLTEGIVPERFQSAERVHRDLAEAGLVPPPKGTTQSRILPS